MTSQNSAFLLRAASFLAVLCLAIGAAENAKAAEPIGSDLYVQVKPTNVTIEDLDQIKALGFAGVRISVLWYKVEKERGLYSYTEPQSRSSAKALTYEQLISELSKRNLKALVVLIGGNPLYTSKWQEFYLADMNVSRTLLRAPSSREEIGAFARFAAYTVEHFSNEYGPGKFTWLIWNEPNVSIFYPPKKNPITFSELIEGTCNAIRRAVPDAKIAGPGLAQEKAGSMPDLYFAGAMLDHVNFLNCIDYITIHPYRSGDPEQVDEEYRQYRGLLNRYSSGRPVPIAVDEWGYSEKKGDGTRTPIIQANRAVRIYLLDQLYGLPFTNIYEWKNSGDNPYEREHNFGLVDSQGRRKAGYSAFATMLEKLKGYSLEQRIHPKSCGQAQYILLYRNKADRKLVMWSAGSQPKSYMKIEYSKNKQTSLSDAVDIVDVPAGWNETVMACIPAQ